MRRESHVRFGGRAEETDRPKGRHRASARPYTELPTRSGSCYLASIVDAFSRRVVGWSMATHMRAELVTSALDAAIVRLRESGIAASRGSVGDCYDAMAESFFATLETELIDRCDWASPAEAKAAVFEFIELFYNRIRRHSSHGNLSPEQFEERYRSTPAVAAG
jgi:putative transposase